LLVSTPFRSSIGRGVPSWHNFTRLEQPPIIWRLRTTGERASAESAADPQTLEPDPGNAGAGSR
jgi:hypothetical protein